MYPADRRASSASGISVPSPHTGFSAEEKSAIRQFTFDKSIATQSSANYFFDILEKRERRNLFENSRLRMIMREAAGLVDRLEKQMFALSSENTDSPENAVRKQCRIIDAIRDDIAENKWIFSLKPEHMMHDAVLKDAVLIAGAMRTAKGLDEDLQSLQHCKEVFGDTQQAAGAVSKLKHTVMELRTDATKRGHGTSSSTGRTGWEAVLYRADGTVDTNMSLFGWDKSEKIEIYKVIVDALRSEMNSKCRAYNAEIVQLRNLLDSLQRDAQQKNDTIENMSKTVACLQQNTVCKSEYDKMVQAIQDVTSLLHRLTSGSEEDGGIPETRGRSHSESTSVVDKREGVEAPSKANLYGNPGLLWHTLRTQKKDRHLPRSRKQSLKQSLAPHLGNSQLTQLHTDVLGPGPSVTGHSVGDVFHHHCSETSMTDSLHSEGLLQGPVQEMVENVDEGTVSAQGLLRELSLACESITEKVLLPSHTRIDKPLLSTACDAHDCSLGEKSLQSTVDPSAGSVSVSPLVLSNDILHYSETLNREINSHRNAIKKLELKQSTLFDHNLRSLSAEAERYYAESIKIGETSENLRNWASVFGQGSASPLVLGLLHRTSAEDLQALRHTAGGVEVCQDSDSREGLPVLEKRLLRHGENRPTSAHPLIRSESAPEAETIGHFKFLPDFRNKPLPRRAVPGLEERHKKKFYRR